MMELILSFLAFLFMILSMSVGVYFGRRALQGSCGGLNQLQGIDSDCDGQCQRPCPKKKKSTLSVGDR